MGQLTDIDTWDNLHIETRGTTYRYRHVGQLADRDTWDSLQIEKDMWDSLQREREKETSGTACRDKLDRLQRQSRGTTCR